MLLQACLGLQLDPRGGVVRVEEPRLPDGIDHLQVRHLMLGKQRLDLSFQRLGERVVAFIDRQEGPSPAKLSLKL
jgi:hypothetical protein